MRCARIPTTGLTVRFTVRWDSRRRANASGQALSLSGLRHRSRPKRVQRASRPTLKAVVSTLRFGSLEEGLDLADRAGVENILTAQPAFAGDSDAEADVVEAFGAVVFEWHGALKRHAGFVEGSQRHRVRFVQAERSVALRRDPIKSAI